jgi:hypothetical protein
LIVLRVPRSGFFDSWHIDWRVISGYQEHMVQGPIMGLATQFLEQICFKQMVYI